MPAPTASELLITKATVCFDEAKVQALGADDCRARLLVEIGKAYAALAAQIGSH